MSVDIKDHRKFINQRAAEAALVNPPQPALLEQVDSPVAVTGDDHLDKMIRAIQATLDPLEQQLTEIAKKGMHAVQADMVRLCQLEYMHTKGKIDVIKEILKFPAQILLESKPAPSGLHSV